MDFLNIKALTIKQPYIDWIRRGQKTLEIRSWKTCYRGDLVLCSAKIPARIYHGATPQTLGVALCIVTLEEIHPFLPEHAPQSCTFWRDNLFAWRLKFVTDIHPFPVKGQLGLFNLIKGANRYDIQPYKIVGTSSMESRENRAT
jgi:hypothetical protein